jgi:hypothetical protein
MTPEEASVARAGYGPRDYANEFVAFARVFLPSECLLSPAGVFARAEVEIQLLLLAAGKNSRPETFGEAQRIQFEQACAPGLEDTFSLLLKRYLDVAARQSTAVHLSELRHAAGACMDMYVRDKLIRGRRLAY